jgi:hypothetical protein
MAGWAASSEFRIELVDGHLRGDVAGGERLGCGLREQHAVKPRGQQALTALLWLRRPVRSPLATW